MNKDTKQIKAVLLLAFIIVSVFGFDYILAGIGVLTGRATDSSGTVQITIDGVNATAGVSANATPSGGSGGRSANIGLEIGTLLEDSIDMLEIEAVVNTPKTVQLILKNKGDLSLTLAIAHTVPALTLDKTVLKLPPGRDVVLTLNVFARESGIYTGVISFKHFSTTSYLPVIVTVQPLEQPYVLDLVIPESFKTVQPGKELLAQVTLDHLAEGRLTLSYLIKNMANTVIHDEREVLVVQNSLSIDKTVSLPEDMPLGDYAFIAEAEYNGVRLSEADSFVVVKEVLPQKEFPQKQKQNSLLIIILVLLLVYIVARITLHKKN